MSTAVAAGRLSTNAKTCDRRIRRRRAAPCRRCGRDVLARERPSGREARHRAQGRLVCNSDRYAGSNYVAGTGNGEGQASLVGQAMLVLLRRKSPAEPCKNGSSARASHEIPLGSRDGWLHGVSPELLRRPALRQHVPRDDLRDKRQKRTSCLAAQRRAKAVDTRDRGLILDRQLYRRDRVCAGASERTHAVAGSDKRKGRVLAGRPRRHRVFRRH